MWKWIEDFFLQEERIREMERGIEREIQRIKDWEIINNTIEQINNNNFEGLKKYRGNSNTQIVYYLGLGTQSFNENGFLQAPQLFSPAYTSFERIVKKIICSRAINCKYELYIEIETENIYYQEKFINIISIIKIRRK